MAKVKDKNSRLFSAISILVKTYNSSWNPVDWVDTSDADPAGSTNDVFFPTENGTYTNMGSVVVTDYKSEVIVKGSTGYSVEEINDGSFNIYSEITELSGYLNSDGSITVGVRTYSDYIEINEYITAIKFIGAYAVSSQGKVYAAFYDSSFSFISTLVNSSYGVVNTRINSIPSGASYIRVTFALSAEYSGDKQVIQLISDENKKIELDSRVTVNESAIASNANELNTISDSISAFTANENYNEPSELTLIATDVENGYWVVDGTSPNYHVARLAISTPVVSVAGEDVTVSIDDSVYYWNYALFDSSDVCKVVGGAWLGDGVSFNMGEYPKFSIQFKRIDGAAMTTYEVSSMLFSADYFVVGTVLKVSETINNRIPSIYSLDNPFNQEANLLYKKSAILANIDDSVQPLVIIAGQSNADGREYKANAPAWLVSDSYKIPGYKMWNPSTNSFEDYEVGVNDGSYGDVTDRFSFDVYFAHEYLTDNPTKTLYAIRQTVGGVPITEKGLSSSLNRYYRWQPRTDLIDSGDSSMCIELVAKIKAAISYSYLNDIQLMPTAILFHQGEGDADRAVDDGVTDYPQNIKNLISWFRGLFCAPSLPFINGYIMDGYSSDYALINDVFDAINALDEYSKTVDMTGHYTDIGDGLHYDEAALSYMGGEMYTYFKSLNI